MNYINFTYKYWLIAWFICGFSGFTLVTGQISQGGIPRSLSSTNIAAAFQEIYIDYPDPGELMKEDAIHEKEGLLQRFAVHLPVDVNTEKSGSWHYLDDGSRIWRLRLVAEGALALGLHFAEFNLPPGSELFIYDDNRKQLLGAFTSENNRGSGLFATDLIHGESAILDLFVPREVKRIVFFTVSEVVYAYRYAGNHTEKGNKGSGFCEVNINCSPEGDQWQEIKNGVVRIQAKVGGGSYWCSGTLVNNARNDKTPYILSADHCAFQSGQYATSANLEQWIFRFGFEGVNCDSAMPVSTSFTLTGATKVAQGGNRGLSGSDFYLVKLIDEISENKDVFYLGWSIENSPAFSGVTIHHPNGDVKKISTFTAPVETSGWSGNGLQSHWKVTWSETFNGWGVTEGGSSGSPLIDDNGSIVGSLTGGLAACDYVGNLGPDKPDYYGKFSYHWSSNGLADSLRLKPWLDPDNTGITILQGVSGFVKEPPVIVDKNVRLFPNPSTGKFTIDFSTFVPSDFRVNIYDLKGSPCNWCSVFYTNTSIELFCDAIPAGVYLVEIASDKEVIIRKVIITNQSSSGI